MIFIGKSIGTIAQAKYVKDHDLAVRQIWYTPLAQTFLFPGKDVIAMIGTADPWSDVGAVCDTADRLGIKMFEFAQCNHSLECSDVERSILMLQRAMDLTKQYLDSRE